MLKGIVARFPLAVFKGHRSDGSLDQFPDTARLMSALTHAAGKGSTAVLVEGDLRPSGKAKQALEWVESNVPTAVRLPNLRMVGANGRTESWRFEGTLDNAKKADKRTKRKVDGVAIDGPLAWLWHDLPEEVAATLEQLCGDVSCLGESDSPVLLEVGTVEPTHYLDTKATKFSRGGIRVRTPIEGRLAALDEDYLRDRPKKRVKDSASVWVDAQPSPITRKALQEFVYREEVELSMGAPWDEVILLGIGSGPRVADQNRVSWCVALHRAIVAMLPEEAPPMLTGKYPAGAERTANRVAVQYLDEQTMALAGRKGRAFAVLVPEDANAEERVALFRALDQIKSVHTRMGNLRVVGLDSDSAADFWPEPGPGCARFWSPLPLLIPETRPKDPRCGKGAWGFEEVALLSVGLLLRNRVGVVSGPKWRSIVNQVSSWGVSIPLTNRIASSDVSSYVHRVPAGMLVEPYTALVDMGETIPAGALFALGQARHLGGGLMVPHDVPDLIAKTYRSNHAHS